MFSRFKTFLIILCIAIFALSVPIYSAARIFLPEFIITKISDNLPVGSKLEIEDIVSNADMSIVYRNVVFERGLTKFFIPIVEVLPKLNIFNPVSMKIPSLTILSDKMNVSMNELDLGLVISGVDKSKLSFEGEFEEMSSEDTVVLSSGNFLIAGLIGSKHDLNLRAEDIEIKISTPEGKAILKFENALLRLIKEDGLAVTLQSEFSQLDISDIGLEYNERILKSRDVDLNLLVVEREQWVMPFTFAARNLVSQVGDFSDEIKLESIGRWRFAEEKCLINELLLGDKNCGKLVDFIDTKMSIARENDKLSYLGYGLCVAPDSGCRQEIRSKLRSSGTERFLPSLISTGLVNPVVGGILMGTLISSDLPPPQGFDHEVNISVDGARILINGKPLF